MSHPDVLAVILSGGTGARLYPLTKQRAKPAVPIGGKYRLVDIPISNCLNSGFDQIYILTQYNTVSLHRHIAQTYKFDLFSHGWVQILAAEQTPRSRDWYQGTADAVRKQLHELHTHAPKDYLVLSSDHLYRMDYSDFVRAHRESGADVTVGVVPTSRVNAMRFGIIRTDPSQCIVEYQEKPSNPTLLRELVIYPDSDRPYLASMGIYVFRAEVLYNLLETSTGSDFAKDILPATLPLYRVVAYHFCGYWEDIATIRNYYETSLALTAPNAPFSFYDPVHPVYSHPEFLPATQMDGDCSINRVLMAEGCRILHSEVCESVIGLRSLIGPNAKLNRVVMMGADYYETDAEKAAQQAKGCPPIGVGRESVIEAAVIDKNARIGDGVTIRFDPNRPDAETDSYVAKDGLVVVLKNAVIPSGTVI